MEPNLTVEQAVSQLRDDKAAREGRNLEAEQVGEETVAEPTEFEEQTEASEDLEAGTTSEPIENEEAEEGPVLYAVKDDDGTERHVPLEELTEAYFNRSRQQARYRQLAEERKQVEQEQEQVRADRKAYVEGIEHIQNAIQQSGGVQDPAPELYQTDPQEYNRLKMEAMEHRQRLQSLEQAKQEELVKAREDAQEQHKETLKQELEALSEKRPEWQDVERAEAKRVAIRKMALEYGFTHQHVDTVSDHRLVMMLEDLAKFKAASTKGAKKIQKNPPRVVRSSDARPRSTPAGNLDKAAKQLEERLEANKHDPMTAARAAGDLLLVNRARAKARQQRG